MKTRFSIVLTALLMLFSTGANAQVKGDVDGDSKVNATDIVELVNIILGRGQQDSQNPQGDPQSEDPVSDDATVSVTIHNASNRDMTMSGMFRFVLCAQGGIGQETSALWLKGENVPVTIPAGNSQTFEGLKVPDGRKNFSGWHFASQAELGSNYASNVVFYDLGTWSPTTYVPDMVSSDELFQDGANISITFSKNQEDTTTPAVQPVVNPGQDNTNPATGNPVVNFNIELVNNTGQTVNLDGDIVFVLGNPDHNGNYFGGYQGSYLRTGHIRFYGSSVSMAPNQRQVFSGLTWRDEDTGLGMGETSPLNPSLLGVAQRPRNVLVYVGGDSEVVLCDNLDPSTIFREGENYTITLSSVSGGSASPAPAPAGASHGVISIGLNITNATGRTVTLDGDVVFVLGNPDHNGNYFGSYTGPYLRTDHLRFGNAVTFAPGEIKTFGGITWRDGDTGYGMGEMSPANDVQIAISERASNVLLYINGNSGLVTCDRMPSSTIFRNGETYNVTFR